MSPLCNSRLVGPSNTVMMSAGRSLTLRGLLVLAAVSLAFGLFGTGSASAAAGHGLFEFGSYPSSPGQTSPHSTGVNPLFYWSELEPSQGAYNWGPLDQALSAAAARGKTVIPRVYTNVAGYDEATPNWVFNAGAAWYYNSAFSESNGMRQPVPTDPVFTAKFAAFLTALGARYNGDPRIEFFQTNAGMGEYGEMVWGWPEQYRPPGWSPNQNIATVKQWIDRWTRAFPRTKLAIMVNCIGWDIAEQAADYAVSKGWYLQQNDLDLGDSCRRDLFRDRQSRTKISVEAENGGGNASTGPAFDALINDIFSHGFPVDYLVLHQNSFADPQTAAKLPGVAARLRSSGGTPPPAPPPPSPNPPPAPTQPPPAPASAPPASPTAAPPPAPTPTAAPTPPPDHSTASSPVPSTSWLVARLARSSGDQFAGPLPRVKPDEPLSPSSPQYEPDIRQAGAIGALPNQANDFWVFAVITAFVVTPVLVRAGWQRLRRVRH